MTRGCVVSASAPGGTNTYTYDDRGNLLSSGGPSGTAAFSYDEEGRLTARTDAAGQATFGYDAAGRLSSVADPLTQAMLSYGYDSASRLTSVAFGGGTGATRVLGYDVLDRPVSDELKSPSGTVTASTGYAYDKASRLTGKTTAGTAGSGSQSYGYDRAGRLTSWTGVDGTVNAYTWDGAGNRTSTGGVTAVYDERNRLLSAGGTTYTYSARGTRTATTDAGGTHTAVFDAFGRMVSADGTAYAYDALGRLVGQGTDTLTYADHSNNPVATAAGLVFRDPAGQAVSSAATDGSNATVLLSDLHGDVTGAIDTATGTLAASTAYSPFGEITARSGTPGPLGYQGEYTDPATGQVNMHARWYDPATGGFSTRDTWTLNPVPSINANRYGYGNANPLTNTDPSGHMSANDLLERGAAVGNKAFDAAKAGGRWLVKHPGKALRFFGTRLLGPIGWLGDIGRPVKVPKNLCKAMPGLSWCAADAAPQPQPQPSPASPGNAPPGKSALVKTGYAPGTGSGGGPCVYRCGGDTGTPPPPPPPPWDDKIKDALFTEVARPVTDTKIDDAFAKFVDDSFTRAQKDLELSEKELLRYFKYFPSFDEQNGLSEEFKNFLAAWNNQPGNCMTSGGESWVYYHPLDAHGRATGVTACLSEEAVDYRGRGKKADPNKKTDIMGGDTTRGRGTDRSNPAGWQYLDGQRGWARGHLLGRQLGGDGRDRRNLVKMHNVANSDVMEGYESIIRSRLDAGERIFYASIPRYEGNDPVPVTVELYALGSSGRFSHWTVYNTPDGLPPN